MITTTRHRQPLRRLALAALALLVLPAARPAPVAAAPIPLELELVLAVDVSSSVDDAEYQLQMEGIARALRDPQVEAAIASAGAPGIGVALLQWSSADKQALAVDWALLADRPSIAAFAGQVATAPRHFRWGQTAIGDALLAAGRALEASPFEGRRRVIDLSGDGDANYGDLAEPFRDQVVARDITINGLAILSDDPGLDRYYEQSVIGGADAFVVPAQGYEDFSRAMVEKLVREIMPLIAQAPPPRRQAPPLPDFALR